MNQNVPGPMISGCVSTQEVLNRLTILNRVARIMGDVEDLNSALELACQTALPLFPEREIAVWLMAGEPPYLQRVGLPAGIAEIDIPSVHRFALAGDPLLNDLVRESRSVSWNEDRGLAGSALFDFFLGEGGYHCLTLVPLVHRGRFLGVLMIGARVRQSLCEGEESEMAGTLAYQLASAVSTASLLGDLQATNAVLGEQKVFLQSIIDAAPDPLFVKNPEGRVILANQALGDLFGRSSAEVVGCLDEDLGIDTDTAQEWRSINREVMETGLMHLHGEQPIPTANTEQRWFRTAIVPFRDLHGVVQGIIGAVSDITERKRNTEALTRQRQFLQTVIDVSPAAIWVKDLDGRYLLINRAGAAIYGSTPEALIGRSDDQTYLDLDMVAGWRAENRRVVESGEPLWIPQRMIPGLDGQPRWFQVVIAPFEDNQQVTQGVIVAATDISERVQAEQRLADANDELERLAQQDGLTGLANRRSLDKVLDREWRRLRRVKASLAVAMLDVDYFKAYNDLQGHLAGDDCLRRVATAMAGCLQRPADLAGRFGGEEFLLIMPNTDSDGAVAVARSINRAVTELAIAHPGSPLGRLTVSLGVAVMVPDHQSLERLLNAADRALYQAKSEGRNRVVLAPIADSSGLP